MAAVSKLAAIGMIIFSIAVGLISFYLISNLPRETKKQQINEIISQTINFIVFIWIAKVILKFPLFIEDPLAVLAHPSNSNAFYLAILFTSLLLIYKSIRRKINLSVFLEAFIQVFLTASFLYEFIQYISGNNTYAFGHLLLLALLLILLLMLRERLKRAVTLFAILTGWTIGMLVLLFIQPFVTVFGYTMAPWFIILFFISICLIIIIKRKWDLSWG